MNTKKRTQISRTTALSLVRRAMDLVAHPNIGMMAIDHASNDHATFCDMLDRNGLLGIACLATNRLLPEYKPIPYSEAEAVYVDVRCIGQLTAAYHAYWLFQAVERILDQAGQTYNIESLYNQQKDPATHFTRKVSEILDFLGIKYTQEDRFAFRAESL
jgi:hypothetical protein